MDEKIQEILYTHVTFIDSILYMVMTVTDYGGETHKKDSNYRKSVISEDYTTA